MEFKTFFLHAASASMQIKNFNYLNYYNLEFKPFLFIQKVVAVWVTDIHLIYLATLIVWFFLK